MKAVLIERPRVLRVSDIPKPTPGRDEVLIAVAACGICGSDIRYLHGDNPWSRQTLGVRKENPPNMPIGHEFAGTVVEVGDDVLPSRIGQRVAVLAYKGCGECYFCRAGKHNICGEVKHIGHSAGWGDERFQPAGFAEYCRVWSDKAFELPNGVSFEQATLLDGLAVAIHACQQARIQFADGVLIVGSGAIGLLILQLARISGARHVVCCDTHPAPLSIAAKLGADDCVQVPHDASLNDVLAARGASPFDVVLDSIGSGQTVVAGLQSLRRGGRAVLMAIAEENYNLPANLLSGERSLTSSANNGYPEFQSAIDLLGSGRIRVDPLITHRFPLADAKRAFEVAEAKHQHDAVKVVVKP